jgi:4-deoxy-L-threo-5-hexosulose-uronate ketol-isomerase
MKLYLMADPVRYARMTTHELRETFLVQDLFQPGCVSAVYVDLDRAVIGSAVPLGEPLPLGTFDELRSSFFTERRELGILNIGGPGSVTVGGEEYALEHLSCLYVGRGNPAITFASADPLRPAEYYLLSYPAHKEYPTALAVRGQVQTTDLGAPETCNQRRISRCIHTQGIRSCQLVMGFTELAPGSVWNTMPSHTHMRRSEIYLYFGLAKEGRVVHLMGPAEETRHLMVADKQVVISPIWSIHSGVGTAHYTFCWGMGGENQEFGDMDPVDMARLG